MMSFLAGMAIIASPALYIVVDGIYRKISGQYGEYSPLPKVY